MHWSSGLAKLTQEHTVMRTHTHRCTCTRVHTHTVAQSCKLFGAQLCSSAHSVRRFSCWPAPLEHTLNCARVYWLLRYLPDMQGFFSLQETIVYQTVMLPHFTYFYKGFVLPEHGNTLRSSFFTSVYYPSISHLPFWRWAADRVEKSRGWQLHCQYSAVSWEETKCISQCGGNVTVLVIRAFKLAALPKHCQTLCERGEILTVLSPLIVGA